jgi:hypothetical protein
MGIIQAYGTARSHRYAAVAAMLMVASLLAGCSSDRLFGSSSEPAPPPQAPASPPSTGSRIISGVTDFFSGSTGSSPELASDSSDIECPEVDVRSGASTLTIPPGGGDAAAMTLRYQGTLGQLARTCGLVGGNTLKMKVGVQGRIILGPAGLPGRLDVPLRFAVVREGPEPKTIVTKYYKVPVTVPEGQLNVSFVHIDEDVSFPLPPGNDLESYVVYVGFDPVPVKPEPAKKPAPAPTPKPKLTRKPTSLR